MYSNDKKCAPNKKYIDGSCFTIDSLKIIAEEYNKINNVKTIEDYIDINNDKADMVKQITKALSKSCSNQICWLRTDIIKNIDNKDIHENTFRPEGPSTGYEWLSTTNIDDVINQYTHMYKDFLFLGAIPNDFEEVPILGLSNINFSNFVKNGKTKIGMVINLDKHDESGSHWVALYTDLINYKLYYFDSVGKKPGKRIKKFNNKILKYMYKTKIKKSININNFIKTIKNNKPSKYLDIFNGFDIRYNKIQHQKKNSECGVYSINFILRLVKGESFDEITQNITSDDQVNKCRNVYFR